MLYLYLSCLGADDLGDQSAICNPHTDMMASMMRESTAQAMRMTMSDILKARRLLFAEQPAAVEYPHLNVLLEGATGRRALFEHDVRLVDML